MTDEEFERIKAAEKDHLRAKQRFQETMEALKRQNKVQSTVRQMRTAANRLLRDNEDLVTRLRSWTARQAARLEGTLAPESATGDDLAEAEEELREARAAELVRQYKAASAERQRSEGEETKRTTDPDAAAEPLPDKTIGRMRERPSDSKA